MISYPPAKINLGLNVVKKRPDGYHNIESIFYSIDLVDILEINKSEGFFFTTSGLEISGQSDDNLIVRAYQLLKKKHNISNVNIHLHKQIPMGAGLGGGSADAAFTLTMLNDIFELELENEKLEEYAGVIGSDCPFFIENSTKYVTGVGDKMESQNIDLSGYYLWLINPEIHISTKEAYEGIIPKHSIDNLKSQIRKDISLWHSIVKNDFEYSAFKKHPILSEIKEKMYNNGALYASMSGSGSTMYAICKEKPTKIGDYNFEKIISL